MFSKKFVAIPKTRTGLCFLGSFWVGFIFFLYLGWNITRGNLPLYICWSLMHTRMSTGWLKKSLIMLGDLNLAWILWTLSIKLQGSFIIQREVLLYGLKLLWLSLLCHHCFLSFKIKMRSWVSSWGCFGDNTDFELFCARALWFTYQWIFFVWWFQYPFVSTEPVPGTPRSHYSGSSHCNSLVFWPHNQTTSPVIPFEVTKIIFEGLSGEMEGKVLFWKAKGHQRSLTMAKNIHQRCSNPDLGAFAKSSKIK